MINLQKKSLGELYHIIYYEWYMDIRAGGPTGYLANLMDGLNRIENNENPLVLFDTMEKNPPSSPPEIKGFYKTVHNFFYQNDCLKSFYINNISRYQKQEHKNYIDFLSNVNDIYCNQNFFEKIDLKHTKTIHVHTVGDAVKVANTLARVRARDIKLMLTCHTPEAPSDEYYKTYLEQGHSRKRAEEVRKYWQVLEKRAFERSDILVFPSKEAMEPLKATMDGFSDIISNKDIRFIASGAKELISTLTREEAKKKYGVEGKFVVGYVGRHNEIKGYDILQEAAKKVLNANKDICFLIGGTQGNTFKPLNHDRWIEAGWVNPADLFMALDVFILPNRMTYFDLVLLEVMSMGIPVIASNTGGNKSVQALTDALILYNNKADNLAEAILKFSKNSFEELLTKRENIKSAYLKNYTPSVFAANYLHMINQIYHDYDFIR